jgi:hypothetical protein
MSERSVGTTEAGAGAVVEAVEPGTPPDSARSLAVRTAVGTGLAVVLALVLRAVAVGLEPGLAALAPFGVAEIASSSVFAGVGAALVYAGAVRFTRRPVGTFLAAAVAVFALSLVAIVAAAPEIGIGTAGQVWLGVLHVAVAVPLTVAVARLVPRRA